MQKFQKWETTLKDKLVILKQTPDLAGGFDLYFLKILSVSNIDLVIYCLWH